MWELRRVLLERQVRKAAFDLRLEHVRREPMKSTALPVVCHRHELHPVSDRVSLLVESITALAGSIPRVDLEGSFQ